MTDVLFDLGQRPGHIRLPVPHGEVDDRPAFAQAMAENVLGSYTLQANHFKFTLIISQQSPIPTAANLDPRASFSGVIRTSSAPRARAR